MSEAEQAANGRRLIALQWSGSTKYEERGRALGSEIRNFCYCYR